MGQYKNIDGIRYEADLLEKAQAFVTGKGEYRISYDEAKALIDAAMDGNRITRTERRTLHYIYEQHPFTDKASEYFIQALFSQAEGLTYDRVLIEAAELAVEGRGDGRISQDDAELIWRMIESDGKVTPVERRTLDYIIENFNCTDPAEAFFREKLG